MRKHSVYRIFGKAGELLYVGCTKDVQTRIYMHLSTHVMTDAYLIHRHYDHHTSEAIGTLAEARAAERAAIKAERPILNRQHNATRWVRRNGEYVPVDQETVDSFNALTVRPAPDPEFADFLNGLFKPA